MVDKNDVSYWLCINIVLMQFLCSKVDSTFRLTMKVSDLMDEHKALHKSSIVNFDTLH